jgi:hypothetical protein
MNFQNYANLSQLTDDRCGNDQVDQVEERLPLDVQLELQQRVVVLAAVEFDLAAGH